MEKKEITFTDEDIKRFKLDRLDKEIKVIKTESNLARMEKWLESDYSRRNFSAGIDELKKVIEAGVDIEGKEVDELAMEDLKIQVELREKELEQDLPNKELRVSIEKSRDNIDMEKANIKKLDNYIRDKRTIITE